MTDLDKKAAEAINSIAQNHDEDRGDVRSRYEELLEDEESKGVSNPGRRALRRLGLDYKGAGSSSSSDAEQLKGYVLGATDPINTSASAVRRARSFVEKYGPEQAIERGMIKSAPSGGLPDGLASLTVRTDGDSGEAEYAIIDTNSNSPTSGEILPEEDYIRYVYGAVWRGADDGPHLFSGVLSNNDGTEPPRPPVGDAVSFSASWVGESDRNNTIRLNFSGDAPFETVDGFGGPSLVDMLEDGGMIGHDALDEADSTMYDRNDVVVTYGSVTYMELAPEGDQSRRLSLVDPFAFDDDLERTVWLADHVEVGFAEESDVFVIGQVSESNNEYPDSIEAVGVVPHPDYTVEPQPVESMGGDDSEPEPEPEPEAADGGDGHPPQAEQGGTTPAEAGAELQDPSEVGGGDGADHDAEFETGATIEDSEQAEKADDGEHLPPVVEGADYSALQEVAAGVESVPGSGISADEMRDRLVSEMGAETLALALGEDGGASEAGGGSGGEAGPAGGDDETVDEAPEESVVSDGGDGPFEPEDEDDEWSW